MSRSRKKNPFIAICCYFSNKKDKTIANKRFRKLSKQNLKQDKDLPYSIREVSNVYTFDSDGLAFYHSRPDFNRLESLGYTEKEIDELYDKIFRK